MRCSDQRKRTIFIRAIARICLAALPPFALACGATARGQEPAYEGDVTDVRVIRHVEKHPQAWRLWQPYIIQSTRKGQLIVAFGAMRNGKKDMGDILATVSKNDGDTWEEPVTVFDHAGIKNSYPTLTEFSPGDFRVVWDSGTADTPRTHIHFGKLKISP